MFCAFVWTATRRNLPAEQVWALLVKMTPRRQQMTTEAVLPMTTAVREERMIKLLKLPKSQCLALEILKKRPMRDLPSTRSGCREEDLPDQQGPPTPFARSQL